MQSSQSPTVEPPPPSIYIDIDPDGTIVWNNEPLSGIGALEVLFKQESRKDPQAQIQLRPSALASYDVVANVMASAQRNNMTRMGFTNVGEFAQ
jgi:biopolymer transport protein ExbD